MSYKKAVIYLFLIFLFFSFLFVFQLSKFNDGLVHITICNVGQGDGIHIRTAKGSDILIDAGGDKKVLDCLSRHIPFWDRTIEAVFLTHPHLDHYGGLIEVGRRYDLIYFGTVSKDSTSQSLQKLQDILADKGLTAKLVKNGDRIAQSSYFELLTYWPTEDFGKSEAKSDPNDHSIVQILTVGDFEMLLTGDAEEHILSRLNLSDIEVLKVPHHGSRGGVTDKLMNQIKPELSIISVGKNSYGHPAEETINILKRNSSKVLRTDLDGEVEIITDGKTWSYKTYQ